MKLRSDTPWVDRDGEIHIEGCEDDHNRQDEPPLIVTILDFFRTEDKEAKQVMLPDVIRKFFGVQNIQNPIASKRNTINPPLVLPIPINVLDAISKSSEPKTTDGEDFD